MKNLILSLIVIFLSSCVATKKNVDMMNTSSSVRESLKSQEHKREKVFDTTKIESGKITITEIDFYTPTKSDVGVINNAAIKSIKQTTIEKSSEQRGENKETSKSKIQQKEAVAIKNDKTSQTRTSPAPDPYRWRYIFYIVTIVAVVLLYLKRQPLLNWIKKLLSVIRRIF